MKYCPAINFDHSNNQLNGYPPFGLSPSNPPLTLPVRCGIKDAQPWLMAKNDGAKIDNFGFGTHPTLGLAHIQSAEGGVATARTNAMLCRLGRQLCHIGGTNCIY